MIDDVGVGNWRNGFPANPGWYNASAYRAKNILRWFNGQYWSWGLDSSDDQYDAAIYSELRGPDQSDVKWRPLKKHLRRP